MPDAVIYFCATMLFLGAAPLPYGYYMILRLVAFAVFSVAAIITYRRDSRALLPWAFGFVALLFNPFYPVHLSKPVWAMADVAAGLFLLVTRRSLRQEK